MKFKLHFSSWYFLLLAVFLTGCDSEQEEVKIVPVSMLEATEQVDQLADQYLSEQLKHHPESAYFSGMSLERHDGLSDNTNTGLVAWQSVEDDLYRNLKQITEGQVRGTRQWSTRGILLEALESSIESRVCRLDLWNVNQMYGWHLGFTRLAAMQPLGNPDLEQQALDRWQRVTRYIGQEIINLQRGLELGYSAPKSVVQRVIQQLDGLLALPFEQSPFYSLVKRGKTADYQATMTNLLKSQLLIATENYRNFLANNYLLSAREQLTVSANPDGAYCYQALLRANTTLERTPEQVFQLGVQTVSARTERVIDLGKEHFNIVDFSGIVAHVKIMRTDRFNSKEEVLAFSQQVVERARKEVPKWFERLPRSPVEVKPFPEYQEGTGLSAHYEPPAENKPGVYWIPLHQPENQRRGQAEVTAVHEAYPGHHLQIAIAKELKQAHPMTQMIFNAGFVEGWARYAEELAEEMGLYSTISAQISRRTWPARGMVVDPGIHAFGWTRQQAVDYINDSGIFTDENAEAMVDRIAILPGQLTAYDSGGLEIFALRKLAEQQLGDRFEIRAFHNQVLENGSITLPMLRSHLEHWIEGQ